MKSSTRLIEGNTVELQNREGKNYGELERIRACVLRGAIYY